MNEICTQCGGYTGNVIIRRLPAMDAEGVPYPIAPVPPILVCTGHPEPATKHDGRLTTDEERMEHHEYIVEWREGNLGGGRFIAINDRQGGFYAGGACLLPCEALSLLAWLTQEKSTLEQLAKERS